MDGHYQLVKISHLDVGFLGESAIAWGVSARQGCVDHEALRMITAVRPRASLPEIASMTASVRSGAAGGWRWPVLRGRHRRRRARQATTAHPSPPDTTARSNLGATRTQRQWAPRFPARSAESSGYRRGRADHRKIRNEDLPVHGPTCSSMSACTPATMTTHLHDAAQSHGRILRRWHGGARVSRTRQESCTPATGELCCRVREPQSMICH
jgi:hypothetical protein